MYAQFKELNSTLNREVAVFERAEAAVTHHLTAPGFDSPHSALEAEAQEYVLGGSYTLGGASTSSASDSLPATAVETFGAWAFGPQW